MNKNEPFTPESVDEQIDQFSTAGSNNEPSARVVQGLHTLYMEQQHLAERVWERLAWQLNTFDNDMHAIDILSDSPRERIDPVSRISHILPLSEQPTASFSKIAQPPEPRRSRTRKKAQRLTLIAASLVALLLVSSLLWVFHGIQGLQAGQGQFTATPTTVEDTSGIYVLGPGGLSKFDSQTHKLVWNVPASDIQENINNTWETPLVIGNTIIVYAGSDVLAFNAHTGVATWSHSFSNGQVTPFLDKGHLYVQTSNRTGAFIMITEIDPVTGVFKDTYQPAQQGAQQAKVHNNILYYLGSDGIGINRNTFLYAVQLPTNVPLWHQLVSHAIFIMPRHFFVVNGIASVQIANASTGQQYFSTFDAQNGKPLGQTPLFSMNSTPWAVVLIGFQVVGTTLLAEAPSSIQNEYTIRAYDFSIRRFTWQKTFQVNQSGQADFATDADTLYLKTENPTDHQISDQLTAFSVKTGTTLWHKQLGFNQPAADMSYSETLEAQAGVDYLIRVIAGPVQTGAKAYHSQENISAFRADSGSPLWTWQSPPGAPVGWAVYVIY